MVILNFWSTLNLLLGPSWSWSYGSWKNNYICKQCLSPLTLWDRIPISRGVLDTTICDEVCQWLTTCRWFSPGTPFPSTNKTDRHDRTEILLKMALNTIYKPYYINQTVSWIYSRKSWNGCIYINVTINLWYFILS